MSGNLYHALYNGFSSQLEAPAFTTIDGAVTTYGVLDHLSAQFAAALKARGVTAGDRVTVQIEKSVGNVALYLAVLRIGAVYQPLNTGYTLGEVLFFVEDASPVLLVCRPQDIGSYGVLGVPIVAMCQSDNEGLWAEALTLAPDTHIHECAPGDLAAILYTSGTTGRPKGAMLSHANLQSNAEVLVKLWAFTADDVLLHALPIFHVHGLFVALHCAMLVGATMLFHEKFDDIAMRAALPKATVMMGVPTFYTRLMALPNFGPADCANMRLFISGSAPMTAEVHEAFEAASGHKVLERYGMTETGMITSNPHEGDRLAGTVGFALPGTHIRVATDEGAMLAPGDTGIVEVAGPNVFSGYWQLPEKTAEEFRADGYFITGDMGTIDNDGRLTLVGRAKDLIISGGYNIYPKEIESVLDALPGVRESAIIGTPHKDLGEGVVAVLVAESDALPDADLQTALVEELAKFKHPRRFYWLDELPRNTMGKVQKVALREQFKSAYES